ncbi:YlbF family regulator [Caldibacillus lycopersici]|uniref:YlbF family regulator n=1 Tax=Perspicuibacillus lycopersici TaxID=1325689 RepID=A0AAE3LRY8_9BACI|nr:YlbF family regulator [Perspicuibacillus lycopersici]MCU9612223.1 YlbF family regulator [Perspicuibacillus lycopersici]
MIATMERVEIIDTAEALAEMVVNSEVAEMYRHFLYIMNTNRETQRKIKRFVQLKERFEEVQRFGRYHPDYKQVNTDVRLAKREMDMDEHVANFKRAEVELQNVLDEISVLIGHSVSNSVKVATGNPFFQTSSCGSGCGSGGSCGCSA